MLQDSFAIYASDECEIDTHINVWTNMKRANYIDIGLRIYKKDNFSTISIYIPYQVSQDDIMDLSEIMKNETVMRGIFNQKCFITISSEESYYDVQLIDCCMRVIPTQSCKNNITTNGNGTIITFEISQWSKDNRDRIKVRVNDKL